MIGFAKSVARAAARRAFAGDYPKLIRQGAIDRPHYGYILYQAADLARRLGIDRISALEIGVAGGRGLLNMQAQAVRVRELTGVAIDVFGFDTGEGLPPPVDHRDLPYIWQEAHFRMDQARLESQLDGAKLVIGNVAQTIPKFHESHNPAPIGAIAFDLDYHSSTVDALRLFDLPQQYRLPRVLCYFDDIYSSDLGHVGAGAGVPLAIDEFNQDVARRALTPLTHLEFDYSPVKRWHRQIYSFADFEHPLADRYIVGTDRQLAL